MKTLNPLMHLLATAIGAAFLLVIVANTFRHLTGLMLGGQQHSVTYEVGYFACSLFFGYLASRLFSTGASFLKRVKQLERLRKTRLNATIAS